MPANASGIGVALQIGVDGAFVRGRVRVLDEGGSKGADAGEV